jgi:hypothetical protein
LLVLVLRLECPGAGARCVCASRRFTHLARFGLWW